jgi:hypothetical protein|tara:strand:- start:1112 stop:2029 length:918 start_codon:yes stop_codon:yes gene_type:complete
MAAKAKCSKKMFENLDRAELRKLAIVGMKLNPAKAYTLDYKMLVSWVYDRATEVPSDEVNGDHNRDPRPFVAVDLEEIESKAFRDGVMHYVEKLQDFVRGNASKAPAWPPSEDAATTNNTEETEVEEPEVKKPASKKQSKAKTPKESEVEAAAPVEKKRRGRPRKIDMTIKKGVSPVKKASPKPKATVEDAPKTKIKKAKIGTKSVTASNDTAATANVEVMKAISDLYDRVNELNTFTLGLADGIKEGFETISHQVAAVRAEQTAANNLLGNALLFLMNSVVYEEGEEKSDLAGIPEPNSYLDLE